MGQRTRTLTEILGYRGWKVREAFFEYADGRRADIVPWAGLTVAVRLVLRMERRCAAGCSHCDGRCRTVHERLKARRWTDLPWGGRSVEIEAELVRVECARCHGNRVERVPWASPYQRQTRRLQQHVAVLAASMPVLHVAATHGLSWSTVRRAEGAALARWDATRPRTPLRQAGVDEKWLGRRHHRDDDYVTIVSNLELGEPLWIGFGRDEETLAAWIATQSAEEKAGIQLFAMDMHRAFFNAVRADPALDHAAIVHDPFHVMKRVNEAVDEVRREVFFRAGPELRRVGRGTRWLFLRAWERSGESEQMEIEYLCSCNRLLARTYQIKEELRGVLRADTRDAMETGLRRILRRTQARANVPLRKLHDSLRAHWVPILALGEHRPPVGRVEALNNNWETLVRRARGYRDLQYLLLKLKFMTANPIRDESGVTRFLSLGLPPPMRRAA